LTTLCQPCHNAAHGYRQQQHLDGEPEARKLANPVRREAPGNVLTVK
jgi:hypothetical protein